MTRRETPIAPCSTELRDLTVWLRRQRRQAGLSYEALGAQLGCSGTPCGAR
jgi:hypothetical protein